MGFRLGVLFGARRILIAMAALAAGVIPARAYSLTQMVADYERPYVYALDTNPSTGAATLLFINTDTEQVERTLPIGSNATDMTVHYGERRLYVTNPGVNAMRVVDLTTQAELAPVSMGTDAYRISAGGPGRMFIESKSSGTRARLVMTTTGTMVAQVSASEGSGDGAIDPTGRIYYHARSDSSAAHITKCDISTDNVVTLLTSLAHSPGSTNLLLSPDGNRLFWQGYVYDTSLRELGTLGDEIWATTIHGELAFSATRVYDTRNGRVVSTLPVSTQVLAVSGDQRKLFGWNPQTGAILVFPMSSFPGAPSTSLISNPIDGSTVSLPLSRLQWDGGPLDVSYQVYFGTSAQRVGAATTSSAEYLGATTTTSIDLSTSLVPGTTYYWRVDRVGFNATRTGATWSFTVAPIVVNPTVVALRAMRGFSPPAVHIALSTPGPVVAWSADDDVPWLDPVSSSGATPGDLVVTLSTEALPEGTYRGVVRVHAADATVEIPVTLDISALQLTQMVADPARPYVYALNRGAGVIDDATLAFIDTASERIEKVIQIGSNPTDMTINAGEGRLYVADWHRGLTGVVDLNTQKALSPMLIGNEVYKINAGRSGRIYTESEDQWITIQIVNTTTGTIVGQLPYGVYEGDGEIEPTGRYYYHSEGGLSSAKITKFDVLTDSPVQKATSVSHYGGPRSLLMSGDGSRLFWQGYVYDASLNELGNLGDEIYATTLHGDLAFPASRVINTRNGLTIDTLPVTSQVMAVSGDQSKLFIFDGSAPRLVVVPMAEIDGTPGPGTNPDPADGSTVSLPVPVLRWDTEPKAVSYQVYFGTSPAAVAAATPASPEYLGQSTVASFNLGATLVLGGTYYWRVDLLGVAGARVGVVWRFDVAPLTATPKAFSIQSIVGVSPPPVHLSLSAAGATLPWAVEALDPWIGAAPSAGVTPGELTLTFDTTALPAGVHRGTVRLRSGASSFDVPITLNVLVMNLTQMLADQQRPYIYALHHDVAGGFCSLVFLNTGTGAIDRVIPMGTNATDMTINYGDGRLYVADWGQPVTHVVDLTTQSELSPFSLGTNVYKINAGRPGRLYIEGKDQVTTPQIVNTSTGAVIGPLQYSMIIGDAAVDPTGRYYYRCTSNSTGAKITKYYIATDTTGTGPTSVVRPPGTRNLILVPDGTRLFWQGYLYDTSLVELGSLGAEIYATTLHGDLAFGSAQVFDTHTMAPIVTLPVTSQFMAVSGDQSKLFLFDSGTAQIDVVPLSAIAPVPGPGLNPNPADGVTLSLPLTQLQWDTSSFALAYQVYLGTDSGTVAAAAPGSPQYLGQVASSATAINLVAALTLGTTYYWRVDRVGFGETRIGPVWRFTVAPLIAAPSTVVVRAAKGLPAPVTHIALSAQGARVSWSVDEAIPWLTATPASGSTPSDLVLTVDTMGLAIGTYQGSVHVHVGSYTLDVPVTLVLSLMNLTQMVADPQRPYIYALQRGANTDALLLFINTKSEKIETVIPIGSAPTDMTIHRSENRLYVSDWQHATTHVVDLNTRTELTPLSLGTDVYKINAGRAGRIYTEGYDQWVTTQIVNTATGAVVGRIASLVRQGDAEIDPTGTFYYHCDDNISNAHITKYEITTDTPVQRAASAQHPYGSRSLTMSLDGSRLFWQGYVFDAALNQLTNLQTSVYAVTSHGDVAATKDVILDVTSGRLIRRLPITSTVMSFSHDDAKLFEFDAAAGTIRVVLMDGDGDGVPDRSDDCAGIPDPAQADLDLDGVGDACDICPAIPNAAQIERAACVAVQGGITDCIHADVALVGKDVTGVIAVSNLVPVVPIEIDLTMLISPCTAPDAYRFYLNSKLLTTIVPTDYDCTCHPTVRTYRVTDPALIWANWNTTSSNRIDMQKSGTNSSFSWLRVMTRSATQSASWCVYDVNYADQCTSVSLCANGSTTGSVSTGFIGDLSPREPVPLRSIPFTGSALPSRIAIDDIPEGSHALCVSSGPATDCKSFTKSGQNRLRINGSSCVAHPPQAEAGPPVTVECASHREALVPLDGSASTDADSTPGTNDDIMSYAWLEMGAPIGSGMRALLPFALGVHDVTLRTVDRDGLTGTDDTTLTVQDTIAPTLTCPGDVLVECQNGGQALVALPPAGATDGCFGSATITNDWSSGGADVSGAFPLGSTMVRFTATDGAGNTASCSTLVTVVDRTPPAVSLTPSPEVLWPPNHDMRAVHVAALATDACDSAPSVALVSVISSEPDDAPGDEDGATSDDIRGASPGTPDFDFDLRAERQVSGDGRTYTIRYRARDASGNATEGTATVRIPARWTSSDEPFSLRVDDAKETWLGWKPVDGALHYDVIRGDLAGLRAVGSDVDLGTVTCLASRWADTDTSHMTDTAVPRPGEAFFYLVQFYDGATESSFGEPSASKARHPGPASAACE